MGKIIVIEGTDASGKATQSELLYEYLKKDNNNVMKLSFPDYDSPSSSLIKMYLNGAFGENPMDVNPYQASVFYAVDRVASFLKHWKADYNAGKTILADRYTTSNAIYQLSKLPVGQWDGYLQWLEEFEYEKLSLPRPDAVLYLDVEPEISQILLTKRYSGDTGKKDIHERDLAFLVQCRKSALYAAGKLGWRVVCCSLSGQMRSVGDIAEEIYALLSGEIHERNM